MATTLHRDEVDGVPTFWVDTGRPTLYAALVVRAGICDETLPTSGWLHLAEHLALHDRDRGTLRVDGSVSLQTTRLAVQGDPAEVAATMSAICDWLADPVLDRLPEESRVLRAESEYRGTGDAATAMLQRFGARGPGLAGYTEPGLVRASSDGVRALIAGLFTRGNAALVLDGPPPAGIRVGLPPGDGLRPLPAVPTTDDPRPAAYVTDGRLVLSGELPRTAAAPFLPGVLQDVLRRDLREGAGGAYAPWSSYEGADADTAVVIAGSDVASSLLPTVAHLGLSGLAALRANGPLPGVVEDAVAVAVQQLRDPFAAAGFADRAAVSLLLGRPVQDPEELQAEIAAVTRDDVAALVPGFADSLLLGVPGQAEWKEELPLLRMPTVPRPVGGTRHRYRGTAGPRQQLVLTDTAVAVGATDSWQGVDVSGLAGVMARADGGRMLVRHDGWTVSVEPTMWSRGEAAVQHIDRIVPSDKVIPVPALDPAAVPRPRGWLARAHWPLYIFFGLCILVVGLITQRLFTVVAAIAYFAALWMNAAREGSKRT